MGMNKSILKRALCSMKESSKFLFPAVIVSNFLSAIKPFIVLHFLAVIVEGLYRKGDGRQILLWAFEMVFCVFLTEVAGYLLGCHIEKSKQLFSCRESLKLTEKNMQMDYQAFESSRVQELLANIQKAQFQRGDLFGNLLRSVDGILSGLFGVLASLVYVREFFLEKYAAGIYLYKAAFESVVFLLLVTASIIYTARNGERYHKKISKRFSGIAAHNRIYRFYRENIFQNYKYGKEIRIFDEYELIQSEFQKVQQEDRELIRRIGREQGVFMSANSIADTFLSGISCLYVGLNAYSQAIGIGGIVKYSGAVAQLFMGINKITAGIADVKGNEHFLLQYYEYLDLPMPKAEENALPETNKNALEFSFEHVYFRYPGMDTWVLRDISFHISRGEHLAIVGQNGSGKTTCMKLLLRLYRPERGEILLNGRNIQEYDAKEYWKAFSVVFQDFKIFSIRLWQNIAGNKKKNEQEIITALAKMEIDPASLYDGIDSFLYKDYDEQGILISGGEAQKLAIAKALYKDAPFFVMDEPSAALDPVAEAGLYEKTNILLKEKTMVFISHRLSSCCFCDRILVFKDGMIAEEGSHEGLLGQNGEYRKLWEAQARYYRC